MLNWILLIVGGLFESGFTFCMGKMRDAEGFAWWWWLAGFIVSTCLSMGLLARACQTIPIGTAYPIWTGIGATATVLLGIFYFDEPATFWRLFFITTLVLSIVGLKIVE